MMNTSELKAYAPKARRDFIQAVTAQAARIGIGPSEIADAAVQGDVLLIEGRAFPKSVLKSRDELVKQVRAKGFDAVMDAIAYTWFNRFVAIRYMELHGYLDHGYRVLSHPEGEPRPEILDHTTEVDLPGLDQEQVVTLKLDGRKDEELYRMLLKAQCNALSKAMPFLFEEIDDETELLLPANLLHTDSLIRKLVEEIDDKDWEEIEVIGWLYQFYISEKKDEVIGKVVKSEDIPAATQLFTPNWIVKYMVQNSLGAQWLATYPDSPLKSQMEFYIKPAEQTEEVKAELEAMTPKSLNPEEITCIDPASGSGHILVEAYEIFKAIYLERGYRQRDVAKLILEKNLFGLDIDERAAQLTGFALMMKGRADDRRLFERGVRLNVMALRDSDGFDPDVVVREMSLADFGLSVSDLVLLKTLFEHATVLGSLIQVPEELAEKLPALRELASWTTPKGESENWILRSALGRLLGIVKQSEILARCYDAIIANPPYMGGKYQATLLRKYAKDNYPNSKSDLFAICIERFLGMAKTDGHIGLMTPFTWMFLKSYEILRGLVLEAKTLQSLIQPEYHAFFDSAYVPVCTFVIRNSHTSGYLASFIKLSDFYGVDLQPLKTLEAIANPDCGWFYRSKPDDFKKIPGSPVAYWVSNQTLEVFHRFPRLSSVAETKAGLTTGDNTVFQRSWYELDFSNICFSATSRDAAVRSGCKWFPCNSGGSYRKWYGNNETVVNWENDGLEIRTFSTPQGRLKASPRSMDKYFSPSVTWNKISSSNFAVRLSPPGHIFDDTGQSAFAVGSARLTSVLLCLGACSANHFLRYLSPTLSYNKGDVSQVPIPLDFCDFNDELSECLVNTAKMDWDSFEYSWDFQCLPILNFFRETSSTVGVSFSSWMEKIQRTIDNVSRIENENNSIFISAYGLDSELTPDVPIEQITLTINPAYRYGINIPEEDRQTRFRQDTMKELVSHAIGCMMGRYSLNEPGLIYAHSGNEGFDPNRYATFPADDDGIIPITDIDWFDDDACNRLIEFISVAWDADHLEENLTFLADNLSPKKNESSRETLRRYLSDSFFKDHLQTYKKRPIYWLFTSGKQKAFHCLVYLHRYNEGSLSRMRNEYVIPLQSKMAARMEKLDGDIQVAGSSAHRKRLEKEKAKLTAQHKELIAFDEKLRHYADMRISLDLDDGVKVNYGKFGDLLAELKAVHGKKATG